HGHQALASGTLDQRILGWERVSGQIAVFPAQANQPHATGGRWVLLFRGGGRCLCSVLLYEGIVTSARACQIGRDGWVSNSGFQIQNRASGVVLTFAIQPHGEFENECENLKLR